MKISGLVLLAGQGTELEFSRLVVLADQGMKPKFSGLHDFSGQGTAQKISQTLVLAGQGNTQQSMVKDLEKKVNFKTQKKKKHKAQQRQVITTGIDKFTQEMHRNAQKLKDPRQTRGRLGKK